MDPIHLEGMVPTFESLKPIQVNLFADTKDWRARLLAWWAFDIWLNGIPVLRTTAALAIGLSVGLTLLLRKGKQ